VTGSWRRPAFLGLIWCFGPICAPAQIDPVKRDLIQIGYNAPFEGEPPLSIYAYYYRNQPDFLRSNLTLRLAISPTYADSELGIRNVLGQNTDLGIGLGGGGYADNYYEINNGKFLPEESFDGYGAQASLSIYHLFNPQQQIPLNAVLRGTAHFATYEPGSDTAPNFQVPADFTTLSVRTGLRWGGREPTLFPALAMELSIWYQTDYRTHPNTYGYDDRQVVPHSQLYWAEAYLAYTLPELQHHFSINVTAGGSAGADRFSAYRLGGFLPMVSEFPLSLPGYYYQEFSAKNFVLFSGSYAVPLDKRQRWNITVNAGTAAIDYLPGLEQPGHWRSGVGGGVFYTTRTWRVMVGYGYGIDAIRSHGQGANSIGLLIQFDLEPAKEAFFKPEPPGRWGGFQRFLGIFGD